MITNYHNQFMLSTDGKMYRKQNPKRESDQRLIDFQFVIKELSQNLFTKAAMSATWQWYNLWGTADPRTPFSTFLSPEDNAPPARNNGTMSSEEPMGPCEAVITIDRLSGRVNLRRREEDFFVLVCRGWSLLESDRCYHLWGRSQVSMR